MLKDDPIIYIAIMVLLFDFITPINGTVKFVISIILVAAIFISAISRIIKGMRENQQAPK